MTLSRSLRSALVALFLVFTLVTSACATAPKNAQLSLPPGGGYAQLERGDTASGQSFGDWVLKTASGLVDDAYVRDNHKLGVVVTPKVQPREIRPLAHALVQGFQHNFPNRDLTVLMYAPDKQLVLTANYNHSTRQITYQ